jgi:hypothetical protein
MEAPPAIERYFECDSRHDVEAILALFTPDAVVIDDGRIWQGQADIRAWQLVRPRSTSTRSPSLESN